MQKSDSKLSVSVIITVFRRTAFLRKAIDSALAQSRPADEIIVTDDSDSREISEICKRQAPGKLRYRSNAQSLGAALNVRKAVEESSGDLVAILNDDDLWEPDFLMNLVPPFEQNPQCVLSFSDHWVIRSDGTVDELTTKKNSTRYSRDILPAGVVADPQTLVLIKNAVPLAMASVIRKDAVDWTKLLPEFTGAYDFWLSCLLAKSGRPFHYTAQRLSRYRVHDGMETARQSADKNENMAAIYESLLKNDYFPSFRSQLRHNMAVALRTCGRNQMRFGMPAAARRFFWRSMRTQPTVKAMAGWCLSWLPVRFFH